MSRLFARRPSVTTSGTPVPVGIATGQWLYQLSSDNRDLALNRTVELGCSWYREILDWSAVQPTSSATYDWSIWDDYLTRFAARGLKPLACVGGTPTWARTGGTGSSPPDSNTTWATFITAAVNRYKASIKHWEIWNEPNHPIFWGNSNADPTRYASLLGAAYDAIKAEDPSATVITGGTSPDLTGGTPTSYSPPDWYDALFDLGAGAKCDAVGHHPYSYPFMPTFVHALNAWHQMYDTTPSISSVLADHGLSKKLWLTEFGAPTNGPGSTATVANNYGDGLSPAADHVDQDLQGKIIEEAIGLVRKRPDRFAGLYIYQIHDRGTDTADREMFFGLRDTTDTAKEGFGDTKAKIAATGGR